MQQEEEEKKSPGNIVQCSFVYKSKFNCFSTQSDKFCTQKRSSKRYTFFSHSQPIKLAQQIKIPAELQAEELFGTTSWPSTPTFATMQPGKVLFCNFKGPSYYVSSTELLEAWKRNDRLLPILTEHSAFCHEYSQRSHTACQVQSTCRSEPSDRAIKALG